MTFGELFKVHVAFAENVNRMVDGNPPQHPFHSLLVFLQQMRSGKHFQKGLLHHLFRFHTIAYYPQTAIINAFAKQVTSGELVPSRSITLHFSVFEEVGHGGSASVPADTVETLCIDMGCVGDGLSCTEREVSICVKDARGPYHYEMTRALVSLAKELNLRYATDVYPFYSSDANMALTAGHDIRHALIGPGVYASHGYERSHIDGALNTLALIGAYAKRPVNA